MPSLTLEGGKHREGCASFDTQTPNSSAGNGQVLLPGFLGGLAKKQDGQDSAK